MRKTKKAYDFHVLEFFVYNSISDLVAYLSSTAQVAISIDILYSLVIKEKKILCYTQKNKNI